MNITLVLFFIFRFLFFCCIQHTGFVSSKKNTRITLIFLEMMLISILCLIFKSSLFKDLYWMAIYIGEGYTNVVYISDFITAQALVLFYILILSLNIEYKPLIFNNIKTLFLLGYIVLDFFGRKVEVSGVQFISCTNIITFVSFFFFKVRLDTTYVTELNRSALTNNVCFATLRIWKRELAPQISILNNKACFSTSSSNLYSSPDLKPIMSYLNADENKEEIVKENKGKSGIYRWTNLSTGSMYVGSSINLYNRLRSYYDYSSLTKKNMIIHKAILKYGYSKFKLDILEYCAPEDCIKREQYYIDLLKPKYNILKIAGSSLGHKHTEETLAKFKERKFTDAHLENLRAHLTQLNKSESQRLASKERMLNLNKAKGIEVEVTDIRTNEVTVYNSLRDTAKALNTDLKAIFYNENRQKEKGIAVPFKKHYFLKIKRC